MKLILFISFSFCTLNVFFTIGFKFKFMCLKWKFLYIFHIGISLITEQFGVSTRGKLKSGDPWNTIANQDPSLETGNCNESSLTQEREAEQNIAWEPSYIKGIRIYFDKKKKYFHKITSLAFKVNLAEKEMEPNPNFVGGKSRGHICRLVSFLRRTAPRGLPS